VTTLLRDDQIQNRQELPAPVADGNSLWFMTGVAETSLAINAQSSTQPATMVEAYRYLVGPALAGQPRAIATAHVVRVTGGGPTLSWSLDDVEADLDDETGRVELRFTMRIQLMPSYGEVGPQFLSISGVAFAVTIFGQAAQ
jgi:hypothetical protein